MSRVSDATALATGFCVSPMWRAESSAQPAGPAAVWAMRLSGFGDGGHDFPGHAPAAAHLVSVWWVTPYRTGTAKHLGSGVPWALLQPRDGAARPRTAQRGGRHCGLQRGTLGTADAEKSTGSHRRRGRRRGDRKDPYHPRSVQGCGFIQEAASPTARSNRRLGRVRRLEALGYRHEYDFLAGSSQSACCCPTPGCCEKRGCSGRGRVSREHLVLPG